MNRPKHIRVAQTTLLNENKARFKQLEKKIIHQIIEDTPDDYTNLSEEIPKDEFHKMVIEKVIVVTGGLMMSHLMAGIPSKKRACQGNEKVPT